MPLTADSIQLGPWKGVRYDLPVEDCAQDELHTMENARVGTAGQVEQRRGTNSYNSLGAANSGATNTLCAQFNIDAATESVVAVFGDTIYDYSSSVWTDRTNGLTVTAGDDNTFEWADANGVLVATNGVDTNAFKISGGAATALDDNARFSKGKHIAWFDNRLWIGNVNGASGTLWHSDIADIETWGATSFYKFGGFITGLVPGQNALVVHTTDGIYTLIPTGNSDTPFIANKQTARAGIAGRSIVPLPGDVQLMILEDGVYEWSGGAVLTKISQHLDGAYWPTLNGARLTEAFAEYFPKENEVWFFLPYGESQTNMNHVIKWNRLTRRWYGPDLGWERNTSALIDEKVHAGDFAGFLLDHDYSVASDSGVSIASVVETSATPAISHDVKVRWIMARHMYDARGDYTMNVNQMGAEIVGENQTLDLSGTGFTLDVDQLDVAKLTEIVQLSQDLPLLGYAPHTSIQLAMTQAGQTWSHRKIFLRYKPLGRFPKQLPSD